MSQLVEIGFANRDENLRLLRKNGGDINKVRLILENVVALYLTLMTLTDKVQLFFKQSVLTLTLTLILTRCNFLRKTKISLTKDHYSGAAEPLQRPSNMG